MGFDPISLIIGGISAVGSIMSGMAGAAAARERARIGEFNAEIAEENAERAIDRAQVLTERQALESASLIGAQRAIQGASGLSGRSHERVLEASERLAQIEAEDIREAGDIEARNYRVDAVNQRAGAGAARSEAGFSLLGGFLNAGTSLIGAARPVRPGGLYDFNRPRGLLA